MVDAARSATFCVPTAAYRDEFVAALELDSELFEIHPATFFAEIDDALTTVHDRGGAPRRCHEGTEIRFLPAVGSLPEVYIHAVSPSNHDVDASIDDLGQMY